MCSIVSYYYCDCENKKKEMERGRIESDDNVLVDSPGSMRTEVEKERQGKRMREGSDEGIGGGWSVKDDLSNLKKMMEVMCSKVDRLGESNNQILLRMDRQDEMMELMRNKMEKQCEEIKDAKVEIGKSVREMKVIRERMKKTEDTVSELRAVLKEWESRVIALEERSIDQEARSRRNNLIFFGMKEEMGEDCNRKVRDLVRSVTGFDVVLERAHRLGRKRPEVGGVEGKPRPIIVKFLDFNHREKVRQDRKKFVNVSIGEDWPAAIRETRKRLVPDMMEYKRKGHQAWIAYPARLIVDGQEKKVLTPKLNR